jgi:signal transduction histidine kinase
MPRRTHKPIEAMSRALADHRHGIPSCPAHGQRTCAATETDFPVVGTPFPEEPAKFLSRAGAVLLSSLDREITLANIGSLAVPALGDASVLDLLMEDGTLRRIANAPHDLAVAPWFDEFQRRHPPHLGERSRISRVMRTGQVEILDRRADSCPATVADGKDPMKIPPIAGFGSCVILPLAAHGRSLGTLSLVAMRPGRYAATDLTLAREFGERAALAIAHARVAEVDRLSDQRKDRVLAILVHELRNPLGVIRSTARALRLLNSDAAAVSKLGDVLERQVGQMTRLIEGLFDIECIAHGKMQLRIQRVDLTAVMGRAAETTVPSSMEAPVQLTLQRPSVPLWVEADPVRLEQVLVNLLNNAVKYCDRGGRVWLTAGREEHEAVLRVRDNGIGILPEMLQRIFDVFAQAELAQQHAPGGLGIGLALVRSIVHMHGGSVEARSDGPRKGSEFVVRLPIAPDGCAAGGNPNQVKGATCALPSQLQDPGAQKARGDLRE